MSDFPIGTIIAWKNATIPTGWRVCDGISGTLDLRDNFIMGASIDTDVGVTGGASVHSHTNPDTSTLASHNHGGSKSLSIGGDGAGVWATVPTSGTNPYAPAVNHSHSGSSASINYGGSHSHTVGSTDEASHIPNHIKRVFIKRIS